VKSSEALTLNDLLQRSGIDPSEVLVFRHRPWEQQLNQVFDWLASERLDLLECYQDSHAPRTEAALLRARYVASFIRHSPGTALFVGLYERLGQTRMTEAEQQSRPRHQELMRLGMSGNFSTADGRSEVTVFNLASLPWHEDWSGRLVVKWPGLERSWYRWADRNSIAVEAIAAEKLWVKSIKAWDEVILTWAELALLPKNWMDTMRQWRGVYLITDTSDNLHYVGSASGSENIYQRWMDYKRTGNGGNKLLRTRDPSNFRFSILQVTAQDASTSEVVALENKWKDRLRTRSPLGLNEN
jgi:hypothetical protein